MRAIQINGVNIEENIRAFRWGRLAAEDEGSVVQAAGLGQEELPVMSIEQLIEHRSALLVDYQNEKYASIYRDFMAGVLKKEKTLAGEDFELSRAVATNLYKLMAYKDEYEVARLYSNGDFLDKLARTFKGDYTLSFHLAPPSSIAVWMPRVGHASVSLAVG